MMHVGYRINKDTSSLFSYTFAGNVMTFDPVTTGDAGEKFSTKISVTSRNTLLRYLALFVATIGGVTSMVDNLRDRRS
jgi:hypothetical protein